MDTVLFAVGLEEALLQINILEKCCQIHINSVSQPAEMEKLQKDMALVKKVLSTTMIELLQFGKFDTLIETTSVIKERESAFQDLIDKNKKLCSARNGSRNMQKEAKERYLQALSDIEFKAAVLKDEIEMAKVNAGLQLTYTEKWELARSEMPFPAKTFRPGFTPASPSALKHEERVHKEIEKVIEIQEEEYEERIKGWQLRYARDIADIKSRLSTRKDKLGIVTKKRMELEERFKMQEKEMNEWLTFKREREKKLERERRAREAALRVQAWWRGLMVRKALGAFKHLKTTKKPHKGKKK